MLLAIAGRFRRHDVGLSQTSDRGDLSVFEELYAANSGRMKSTAFHLLGDRADAEDAVQEAFLKIYRGMHSVQSESGLVPWMFRVLINCCYDAARKRRRQPEAPLLCDPPAAGNVPLAIALRTALDRIEPQHRLVFWLFEVEGFRHSEVACMLEIPEGTSRKWLFEAKRELKRLLGEVRP
jgi:RNA polymerase sigma-70 factor (ECF subfamily)